MQELHEALKTLPDSKAALLEMKVFSTDYTNSFCHNHFGKLCLIVFRFLKKDPFLTNRVSLS